MRLHPVWKIGALTGAMCVCVCTGLAAQAKDVPGEIRGLPPRATPADYQAHTQAGDITIAAEFKGHAVPTHEDTLSTEEYAVVEIGVFGAPGKKVTLSPEDFSLRINGKKSPQPSEPFGVVIRSVKDPEWVPPEAAPESKSKTSFGSGQKEEKDKNAPPPPVPLPVQRAIAQRVQKAVLPQGERTLPQAGLLFFQYRGKVQSVKSLELIYSGAAGKATLELHP